MRRTALLLAVTTAWTSPSLPAHATASPAVITSVPTGDSCPVGFSAERRAVAVLQQTAKPSPLRAGQTLELTFDRHNAPRLKHATLIVHGSDGRGEILPASSHSDSAAIQTIELPFLSTSRARLVHAGLSTGRVAVVSWVELTRLEYADGSAWQTSQASRCRATPDGFQLVASAP